jgi:hypothetical protein
MLKQNKYLRYRHQRRQAADTVQWFDKTTWGNLHSRRLTHMSQGRTEQADMIAPSRNGQTLLSTALINQSSLSINAVGLINLHSDYSERKYNH